MLPGIWTYVAENIALPRQVGVLNAVCRGLNGFDGMAASLRNDQAALF
jgi:hypothetical protein